MREPITLTHSTWVEDNGKPVKVLVYPEHIFSVMYMPASKAVAVQSIAGAYVTVLESVEQINNLIKEASEKV